MCEDVEMPEALPRFTWRPRNIRFPKILQRDPLRLSKILFRDDRLVSRSYTILFFVCSLLVIAMIPIFRGTVNTSQLSFWGRLHWSFLGVFGTLGMFFLWIGMWFFWANLDHSNVWIKRAWFLVLLFGFWYGSILYYFVGYLPQALRSQAVRRGLPSTARGTRRSGLFLRILISIWASYLLILGLVFIFPKFMFRAFTAIGFDESPLGYAVAVLVLVSAAYFVYRVYRRGTSKSQHVS
jgi:hypothetical protein